MNANPAEPRVQPGAEQPGAEQSGPEQPGLGPDQPPAPSAAPVPEPVPVLVVTPEPSSTEKHKERAVVLRVLVYVAVAHFMAFFLWLMFAVIGKR
jgi:hypothetical protein